MHIGLSDAVLWLSGTLTSVALLVVLLAKKRLHSEPVFTCWIAWDCVSAFILFLIYRHHSPRLYFLAYWASAVIDFALQIGVIVELARSIFYRRGSWMTRVPSRFALFASLALGSSIVVAIVIKPAAATPLDTFFARANLLMTMVFCTGLLSIISVSRQLGISWSARAMRMAYGFCVWIVASFAADTLHTFWQFSQAFTGLEHARMIISQFVAIYWTVLQFLVTSQEPARSRHMTSDLALVKGRLRAAANTEIGR